jgi:hypothetical protein
LPDTPHCFCCCCCFPAGIQPLGAAAVSLPGGAHHSLHHTAAPHVARQLQGMSSLVAHTSSCWLMSVHALTHTQQHVWLQIQYLLTILLQQLSRARASCSCIHIFSIKAQGHVHCSS